MSERTFVLLILVVAFSLRFRGVDFGLPDIFHADEPIVVHHALGYGSGDFNPHFFNIPPLISYLLFGVYGIYYLAGVFTGSFGNVQAFEALFYSDPSSFYYLGRLIFGVLMGTYSVYLLYRLVRANLSREHAVLAAFFLAISYIHVRDSHYIYTDIPLVLVMILSLGVFFRHLGRNNEVWDHVLSGLFIGLSAAVKYNGVMVVIPYLVITASESITFRKALRGIIFAGMSSIVTFIALNPYAILDYSFFLSEISQETKAHVGGNPFGHHFFRSLVGSVGWPIVILGLIGIFKKETLTSYGRRAMVGFLIGYFILIQQLGQPYARYVLPMLPFFLIFTAEGFMVVVSKVRVRYAGLLLLILCATLPLTKSIFVGNLLTSEDTRTQARKWIEENVPSGSKIALDIPFYMPRLKLHQEALEKKRQRIIDAGEDSPAKRRRYATLLKNAQDQSGYDLYHMSLDDYEGQSKRGILPYDVFSLKQQGIDYVIASQVHENPPHKDFYQSLDEDATLVMAFSPFRSRKRLWPLQHPLTGAPFLMRDLLMRERNGQRIQIYKL